MRFNTKSKRLVCRKDMIFQMRRLGYMYNNSAEEIVDKWINEGLNAYPVGGLVSESLRIAKANYIYDKKNK